ncbi:MAG TPA: rhodanese-like domain-containing protein [Geobacteraceae bacterium]|nr:rhodanese-like domain-containing protein [Geobacteraceae bacterium]
MTNTLSSIAKRTGIVALAAIAAVLVFLAPALAAADFAVITTDEVKKFIDQKENVVLIDARTPEEFKEAHIVGSVNIPEKGFEQAAAQLPADKKTLLVFYCNGVKCGKSKRVAQKVAPLGYTAILIYKEGIPVWEERNLPLVTGPGYGKKIETTKLRPNELDSLIKAADSDYVLVDVRDEAEFKEGHIPTAINIPAETLATKSDILPKEKKIIVYCNTGSRSYLAYKKLIGLAYPHIYQALFAEWKEAGLPVAGPKTAKK